MVARQVRFDYFFNADFRDLFEVRGMARLERGRLSACVTAPDRVAFHYAGLDKIGRRTLIGFSSHPECHRRRSRDT